LPTRPTKLECALSRSMPSRYEPTGPEAAYEPRSRRRVLRNKLGITRVRDIQQAESDALLAVQDWALNRYSADRRFTAEDIRSIHRQWLGHIYTWAGEYRTVNLAKGDFVFAAAEQVPRLMEELERNELAVHTPCSGMDRPQLVSALAHTHAELVIIHPFREGNGRCARLLAWLMALQAGLPPLDFGPLAGRGKRSYIGAIHAAFSGDYAPMAGRMEAVIRRTLRASGGPCA
jgi:cell filamentation protein